jgi:peptide/nickel transport system ATP-binding protein
VELAATDDLFRQPLHPYTAGLLGCVPHIEPGEEPVRLEPIPGSPPDLADPPEGCRFHPRCPLATEACLFGAFPLREVAPGRLTACIRHDAVVGMQRGAFGRSAEPAGEQS